MPEAFLHYLWQFQYFDKRDLITTTGERVEVIKPGLLNAHAGPDFAQAKISIDGIRWAGSVEIHVQASEWYQHGHHRDQAYEQVVLHVVWENDKAITRNDGTLLPTLELKGRVDENLMREYRKLINNPASIPCRKSFPSVERVVVLSMLDRALARRLEDKATQVMEMFYQNNKDWDETAYQVFARNFGFKVNGDPFLALAKSLPCKLLQKHADQPHQVEALLFGQAGFLDVEVGDEYYQLLQREYHILSKKYRLTATKLARSRWRFLRMRPANFPTVRIGQFASLVIHHPNLLSKILAEYDIQSLRALVSSGQSVYWQTHYRFNIKVKGKVAPPGDSSVDNILVNSVVPLLVAHGLYTGDQSGLDRASEILEQIPPESNTIIETWKELGYAAVSAHDSQALIELYNHYCQKRNCLNCAIGASLLKPMN